MGSGFIPQKPGFIAPFPFVFPDLQTLSDLNRYLLHQILKTMQAIQQTTDLTKKIKEQGYIHLPFSTAVDPLNILSGFGKVIFESQIRENHKSSRLLASNKAMGFHTDHFHANYIAWFCHSQAFTGGESLLLDTQLIIKTLPPSVVELLREINVQSHKIFYHDKMNYPLLSEFNEIYYADWMLDEAPTLKHKKALETFQKALNEAPFIKLQLSEGDLLIIDNHRMLHGRSEFPFSSNRWLTRYWLSSK